MRLVLGMDVVCRAAPNRAAAPVLALGLGESVLVRATANDQESGTWYEVAGPPRPCWLFAALTVPFAGFEDPDRALISIADHALALQPKATFQRCSPRDWWATNGSEQSSEERLGLGAPGRRFLFDPGDLYHVRSTHFWLLHERHAASPVAEEIA